jgi:arginyl-tRNA synthetase
LEDVLNDSVKKAYDIVLNKNPNLKNKEEVSKSVGIGAVIFSVLSNVRIKDTVFSLEKVLNFDGDTSPYMQYTYARIASILRKANKFDEKSVNYDLLSDDNSIQLIYKLSILPEVIRNAADKNEPSLIAKFAIDISHMFNKFYNTNRVIVDDYNLQNARVVLCYSVKVVLEIALGLLGIDTIEDM